MKLLPLVIGLALAGCLSNGGSDAGQLSETDAGRFNPWGLVRLDATNGRHASAAFFTSLPDRPCAITSAGPCFSWDCTPDAGGVQPATGGSGPALVGAGTITARVGSGELVLEHRADGAYSVVDPAPGRWWDGGEAITVTATGLDGGVPAFSATLTAPAPLAITAPGDGGVLEVTRGSAWTLAWTAGSGEASITLDGLWTVRGIHCTAEASAGSLVIPGPLTQVLERIPYQAVSLTNARSKTVAVGDWSIRVAASTTDVRPVYVR